MLSPFPKSTVISPGTPRKACITRRWTFSLTCEILEKLADRLRSIPVFVLQDLLKTSSEIRREIIQCFEQRLKELLCVRTVHRELSSPERKSEMTRVREYEELLPGVNCDAISTAGLLQPQPVIGLQQTAESCPTCDRPGLSPHRVVADEELVVASLVIAINHL
jgi:hypothetical protein